MANRLPHHGTVGATDAELYDFRRPMKLPREYARVLEMALGTFTRHFANQLVARLRIMITAELGDLEMRTYDEYIARLPQTTCVVTMTFQGGRGTGVLQFPRQTALAWVDHLLGGQSAFEDAPDRELTEIEISVLEDFLTKVFRDLDMAFSHVLPLETRFKEIQYNPQFLQATDGSTPVVFAPITLRQDEREDISTIMMPVGLLTDAINEGHRHETRSAEQIAEANMIRSRLMDSLEKAPLEVAVRFSRRTINPRELHGLAIGDTLPLIHPTSRPLDVMVGDLVLAEAAAGTSGSRLAAMVVALKKEEQK